MRLDGVAHALVPLLWSGGVGLLVARSRRTCARLGFVQEADGGFVGRVLVDELALEGPLEDGLAGTYCCTVLSHARHESSLQRSESDLRQPRRRSWSCSAWQAEGETSALNWTLVD